MIENHNPHHNPQALPQKFHGHSSSSDLVVSSPTMTDDDFSSLRVGSYTPSEVQDDYTDAMSSALGEAGSSTASPVAIQGQNTPTQEVSPQGQQHLTKKEKDKERKRVQRSEDDQYFTKICTLLKIPQGPKKTFAYRGEWPVFILGGGIERITVLVGIEALLKRQELDSDLRHRLEESEREVAALREDLARVSAQGVTDYHPSMKPNTAPCSSATGHGATRQSWP